MVGRAVGASAVGDGDGLANLLRARLLAAIAGI
jgi:hypothetical protein